MNVGINDYECASRHCFSCIPYILICCPRFHSSRSILFPFSFLLWCFGYLGMCQFQFFFLLILILFHSSQRSYFVWFFSFLKLTKVCFTASVWPSLENFHAHLRRIHILLLLNGVSCTRLCPADFYCCSGLCPCGSSARLFYSTERKRGTEVFNYHSFLCFPRSLLCVFWWSIMARCVYFYNY